MTFFEWGEQEVQLACKKENPNWDPEDFDYGCNCYTSALKAFKSICDDDHSGMSFGLTKAILIKLLNEEPLSPITDEDFFINSNQSIYDLETLAQMNLRSYLQCPRKFSLFREETLEGKISYHDNSRVTCITTTSDISFRNLLATHIIDEMFPIQMPYSADTKYLVTVEEFLTDSKNGDFDTLGILFANDKKSNIPINRYFKEDKGRMVEISKEEYDKRKFNKIN